MAELFTTAIKFLQPPVFVLGLTVISSFVGEGPGVDKEVPRTNLYTESFINSKYSDSSMEI